MSGGDGAVERVALGGAARYREWTGPRERASIVFLHPIRKDSSTWDNAAFVREVADGDRVVWLGATVPAVARAAVSGP